MSRSSLPPDKNHILKIDTNIYIIVEIEKYIKSTKLCSTKLQKNPENMRTNDYIIYLVF